MEVHWYAKSLPYISFITSQLLSLKVKFVVQSPNEGEPELKFEGRVVAFGDIAISRYFISQPGQKFSFELGEIDSWTNFALKYIQSSKQYTMDCLNEYLKLRTYFVGYHITIADVVIYVLLKQYQYVLTIEFHPHLYRWYQLIASLNVIKQADGRLSSDAKKATNVRDIPSLKQENSNNSDIGGLPPLKNAIKGQVKTRFPPEASGYLHIGHVKAAILNATYAKLYEGKLLLRFDDTNPSKEKEEYENAIIDDLKLLGIKADENSYTSDYFDVIIEFAKKLINDGKAYMDNTEVETMRNERLNKINSKNRDLSIEENMRLFNLLLEGTPQYCLRAKIDMSSENGTMRDPVLFRYNELPHARTGDKYKAYPTYDLACPIVDSIEGVTHAMRTTEYNDRDEQYHWIQENLGIRHVEIQSFSRLNFQHIVMSKRKLLWLVQNHEVDGWDDPRFPTVKGIIKRGVNINALKSFILAQGFSRNIVDMEWNKFWTFNKKEIDPIAPRYMAVYKATAVELRINNLTDRNDLISQLHPKNESLGNKKIQVSDVIYLEGDDAALIKKGEEITLMRWGNVMVEDIIMDGDNISHLVGHYVPDGDFKKTEKKLNWVAKTNDMIEITLFEFDYIISKPKLEENDNFIDFLTSKDHPTKVSLTAYSDPNIKAIKEGDMIQLERRGYFRVNRDYDQGGLELYMVPDGKSKPMSTLTNVFKK